MDSHPRVLRRLENIVAIHRLRKSPPLQTPYFLRALRPKQLSTVCGLAHLPPLPKNRQVSACRFFIQAAGLVYHWRTKCGVYHQGRQADLVSHHALACISLRLDDIQCFALMISRNKLRMIYTPLAWFGTRQFKPNLKVVKISFLSSFHKKSKSKGLDFCFLFGHFHITSLSLPLICLLIIDKKYWKDRCSMI